jgi:hypothetical protein
LVCYSKVLEAFASHVMIVVGFSWR